MVAASISIQLRFEEAIAAAKARGVLLPEDFYTRLPQEARAQAFTVSGLATLSQIQQVLDSLTQATADGTQFEEWRKQALENITALAALTPAHHETIFRNAIQSHYGAGRWIQTEAGKKRRPFVMYDAINDGRTRPTHRAMDNFIAPVDDAIWDAWAPPNGHNCFLPGTHVRGDFKIGMRSTYRGEAVEIRTVRGNVLRVTANHPVLTNAGWLRAKDISNAHQLIHNVGADDAFLSGVVNNNDIPTVVEDVFATLSTEAFGVADISAFDFHNDAYRRYGDVDVVGSDIELLHGIIPHLTNRVENWSLKRGNVCSLEERTLRTNASKSPFDIKPVLSKNALNVGARAVTRSSNFRGCISAAVHLAYTRLKHIIERARGFPRLAALALNSARCCLYRSPFNGFSLTSAAHMNPAVDKHAPDRASTNPEISGDGFLGSSVFIHTHDTVRDTVKPLARLVGFNEIASVDGVIADSVACIKVFDYSGHVYDFETKTGLILAEGIVTHNCRCSIRSLTQSQAEARGWSGTTKPAPAEPDEGWAYNPGKGHGQALQRVVEDRLKRCEQMRLFALRGWLFAKGKAAQIQCANDDSRRHLELMAHVAALNGKMPEPGVSHFSYVNNDKPDRLFASFMREFGGEKSHMINIEYAGNAQIDSDLFMTHAGDWKINKRGRYKYLAFIAETIKNPQETWLRRLTHADELYLFTRFMRGNDAVDVMAVFTMQHGKDIWLGKTAYAFDSSDGLHKKRAEIIQSSVLLGIQM